jgi:23S rRNA (guanine2445-N2)-methyltransferase / 23S rRNA (guanine2069-N7)-methyltransferase
MWQCFATTPKGMERLLFSELTNLGVQQPKETVGGVSFAADLLTAYRVCLWSRLANRVLLKLASFPAATPEELYSGVQSLNWSLHLDSNRTLAVQFVSVNSQISHTLFGAQKVKDAIVDQLRDQSGQRPSVSKDQPDVSVYAYVQKDVATISLDLSGESLHKRAYRLAMGAAPLKENLAAALLLQAGWAEIAKQGGSLLDPMCGSGTLLIEAAMIAGDIAPGLLREYFGFLGWKQHRPALWKKLVAEAEDRRKAGLAAIPSIIGYDHDPYAIKIAFENIASAGLSGSIHVEKRPCSEFAPLEKHQTGLIMTNPPYGERLGELDALAPLYTLLGERLKDACVGWKAAVFTGNPELGKQMGLRAKNMYSFYNGAIPCKLLIFDVAQEYFVDRSPEAENTRRIRHAQKSLQGEQGSAIQMFVNRLRKNLKNQMRQVKQHEDAVQRVYDADLPDYQFAIDLYSDKVHLFEYEAPRTAHTAKVLKRRQEVLAVLPEVLERSPAEIYYFLISKS